MLRREETSFKATFYVQFPNLPSRPRPLLRVDPVYGGWHIDSDLCVESPALCRTTQECLGYSLLLPLNLFPDKRQLLFASAVNHR